MAVLDGLGRALKKLDCAVLGNAAYLFGSLNALQGLDQGTAANVINGYRRLRGCDPAGDPEPPNPLLPGGQCAVPYRVFTTLTNCSGVNQGEVLSGVFQGPFTYEIDGPGDRTCDPPNVVRPLQRLRIGDGTSILETGNACCATATAYQFRFERVDGLPDSCGNQPGPLPPPTNINFDVDITYNDEGDNPVNITIPVQFNPFTVNFNGDINFPIEFSLGGVDFNGDVNFAPEFNLNVKGPSFPKGGGGKSLPKGDPADERPEAAPEAIIVGAVVSASAIGDNAATGIDFANGPDIFVPRLGSLKFAYSVGAATFWSNDIDVKGPRVFIPCPFSQGADAIAVSPVPGVSLSATPVFGFPLATIGDIKVVLDTQ